MTEPRYRVTEKRAYIVFPDGTQVKAGHLVPKDTEVEDWLIEAGWVEED